MQHNGQQINSNRIITILTKKVIRNIIILIFKTYNTPGKREYKKTLLKLDGIRKWHEEYSTVKQHTLLPLQWLIKIYRENSSDIFNKITTEQGSL